MSSGPGALRPAHSMRAGLPAPMRHRSDARCLPLVRTSSKLAKSKSIVFSSGNGTFCVPGRTSAVFVDSSRGFARCHCVSTEPGFETLMSTSAPGCQRSDSETDRDRPRCGECRQRDFPAYLGRTETDRDPVTVLLIPRSKVRILHGPSGERPWKRGLSVVTAGHQRVGSGCQRTSDECRSSRRSQPLHE